METKNYVSICDIQRAVAEQAMVSIYYVSPIANLGLNASEPTLKNIARELVSHVRKSVTIDWTLRESAQAQIRVLVRLILRKYGYSAAR